ncbi:MAG: glycerol-3-phosphate 1-O-acyltransferase [endosymbiont of Galathealinum brachiosum]|uniref:Glycerol-3-phosphate acyltransferase n=1 Tax=endosymbiont of Galathealinum brachiosum TaxID=2200906 RepID=A0A370DNU4_9GAMM|nr:MAG: glycerol-3-phosphate 1-O-acyltransferase [endosymbiont of Galathealinum brachiosum]
MNIRKSINFVARKVLYLFVKAETLPNKIEQLNINPDVPVVYVLDARAWSNLLVLETECENQGLASPIDHISSENLKSWHSVYTIAPRQPFRTWLQKQPKRSRMLRGIVEILRENPEQEIQFVPVTVFWGRPVAIQKHWLAVLFADSWGLASRTRKLLTILIHGRNTLVNFTNVVNYRGSAYSHLSNDEIIDKLQFTFSTQLNNLKSATLGPNVSHRGTLVRKLILNPDVQKAIVKRSKEDNRSEYKASLQARRYLNEIVANCTNITIQLMQRGLTSFWNKFYSGIEVTHNENLKNLALTHELVYVPCHRSHIDYLLLSYVIYGEGMAIPYIAAGKNLNMPVLGSILRGGGAFFIRRSFKGNELYSTVMFEYVAALVSMGMPIEYFVEGGRSRTGRLLKPKPGMIAMTIRGFLKYRKLPVAFIPVYIGYEKLLESKAYQAELSGEDKKSETFFSSMRSMLRIRGRFGKVYTNFGQPVFLNQLLENTNASWANEIYSDSKRPEWLRDVVDNASQQIMSHINQAAIVNSINLVSTVLLATSKQHMDENALFRMLDIYKSLIESIKYSDRVILTSRTGKEQVEHAEYLKMVKRRTHPLGDIIYLDSSHSVSMTYYRNNILHLMALPSLIACCFFNVRSQTREEIVNLISLAYPFLKSELFLVWEKDQLADKVSEVLDVMADLGLLIKNEQIDVYTRPGSGAVEFSQLNLLAKVISPILEIYYLTLALLSRKEEAQISINELVERSFLMAQRVAMIYELNSPDFSDKRLISNFIDTLIHIDYLRVYDTENIEYSDVFHKADKRIQLLLSKEMRSNILQMLKINQQGV